MKFAQLIECNIRNIFLKKSYIKSDGETILRRFSEILKLNISLGQLSKNLYHLILLYVNFRVIEIY